jgi:ABC-type multidrug transport system fused ATPase/permease subunit
LLSPMVSIVVALCTGIVLWRGTSLIVAGTMTAGALTVYLAYLTKFFKPMKDLASMTSAIAQTTVALERIQGSYPPMTSFRSTRVPSIQAASKVGLPSNILRSATATTPRC